MESDGFTKVYKSNVLCLFCVFEIWRIISKSMLILISQVNIGQVDKKSLMWRTYPTRFNCIAFWSIEATVTGDIS